SARKAALSCRRLRALPNHEDFFVSRLGGRFRGFLSRNGVGRRRLLWRNRLRIGFLRRLKHHLKPNAHRDGLCTLSRGFEAPQASRVYRILPEGQISRNDRSPCLRTIDIYQEL